MALRPGSRLTRLLRACRATSTSCGRLGEPGADGSGAGHRRGPSRDMDAEQSMAYLRRLSMEHHRKLVDIAAEIVRTRDPLSSAAEGTPRAAASEDIHRRSDRPGRTLPVGHHYLGYNGGTTPPVRRRHDMSGTEQGLSVAPVIESSRPARANVGPMAQAQP